ncbi:MAG TPA: BamA/TamA family outer membrane protein [Candidatus Eisenbacteria bacterium]|nr:BamA/TamA family outer membrane protein [Candidatus Eisenbacteria bacterium]
MNVCLVLAAASVGGARPADAQDDLLGEMRTVAKVRFEGRHRVGAGELRSVMKTRSPSIWPWRDKPIYRLDFLHSDTLAIRDRYLHHGFLDARVAVRVDPMRDSTKVAVTFLVHEGERSRVSVVEFTGVQSLPERNLRRKLLSKPGQPFDPFVLQLDTLKISEIYQEQGFVPRISALARRGDGLDSLRVSVSFEVVEGPQYLVGDALAHGYEPVDSSLVMRELLLKRDDVYRRSRVVRSGERLYDTGLFSQVQISPIPDSSGQRMNFDLRVRARKARWVDAGIGSGTAERLRGTLEWGHRNLLGRGFQGAIATRVAFNGRGRFLLSHTEVSLLEPWLLRTRTRAIVTPFYEQNYDRANPDWLVKTESRGFKVELVRELNRFSRASISQNNVWANQDLTLLSDTLTTVRRDSLEQSVVAGYSTHSIGLSAVRDYRDNPLNASTGSMQALTAELAGGPFKGTSSFRKADFVSAWYTPFRNGMVFATRVRAGTIKPTGFAPTFSPETDVDPQVARVPLNDRFRTGGVNSIRGYAESSIPRGGGLTLFQANAELRVPIAGPLGLELYLDAGNVWARPSYIKAKNFRPRWSQDFLTPNDVRYVFGFGPRINLPIGPLRVDVSWSLRPEPDQPDDEKLKRGPRFQFAIGPSF